VPVTSFLHERIISLLQLRWDAKELQLAVQAADGSSSASLWDMFSVYEFCLFWLSLRQRCRVSQAAVSTRCFFLSTQSFIAFRAGGGRRRQAPSGCQAAAIARRCQLADVLFAEVSGLDEGSAPSSPRLRFSFAAMSLLAFTEAELKPGIS